jgi:membrane fusion protein, copper/silver efflux system
MKGSFYNILLMIAAGALFFSCKQQKKETHTQNEQKLVYTCPMHPQIIRDRPGNCPICGMALVKKATDEKEISEVDLNTLLQPTNEFVASAIRVTTIQNGEEQIEIDALGSVGYDTRFVGNISARVTGRVEKLYVRYRYQKVSIGQKIMDIYSPELMTAQQNLLFVLKNDPNNASLISAAKQRLLLLGFTGQQLNSIITSGKPDLTISVYSNYAGHIHEAGTANMSTPNEGMRDVGIITEELSLKEGMYLQKGQAAFTVYNPNRAWVVLSIYGEMQSLIKRGNPVRIIPETAPHKNFRATINFIEPFFRKESKTLTARVYFDNAALQIPIGSQVKATIFGNSANAFWLPAESVISLGLRNIVFLKGQGGFKAHEVQIGLKYKSKIQIVSGLRTIDTLAVNAQYLMDSESFIKVNKQ